jgi:hypothetical protein
MKLNRISEDTAAPFDATHAWQDGDTIPRRLLHRGDGSHADITVLGRGLWKDGFWDVTLKRAMDTGQERTSNKNGVNLKMNPIPVWFKLAIPC